MFKHITISCNFSEFLNADYNQHLGSCITHQVQELKDIHQEHGGFPDSYDKNNTAIRQLWWTNSQIDFDRLGSQLNMEVVTVSTILQPPGNVIPIHRDTFFQIKKRYPNDKRLKVRANIYLQDWKMGHLIHYKNNNEWYTHTHWKQGEGLLWDDKILHVGANIGLEDKITLQVSGFYNE
jgi:hypothetical protein